MLFVLDLLLNICNIVQISVVISKCALFAGPYPEVDAGGGGGGYSRGYSLFQAATPFWGVFNLQYIFFSLARGGGYRHPKL